MSSTSSSSEDKNDIGERNSTKSPEEEGDESTSIKSKSPQPDELPSAAKLFETDSEDEDDDDEDEDEDDVDKSSSRLNSSKLDEPAKQSDESDSGEDGLSRKRPRLVDDDDDDSVDQLASTSTKSKKAPKIVEEDEDDERPVPSQSRKSDDDGEMEEDDDDKVAKSDDDDSSGEVDEDDVEDDDKEGTKRKKRDDKVTDEEDEDEDDEDRKPTRNTVYDFDIMMAKKKEENSRRRKRKNYDIINDNDDIIAEMINQMRDAVELDCEANKNRQAATRKLKMLPFVVNQLRKVDLRDAFLDSDILSAITEWLTPLPDKSLPHLNIRESLLKILQDFHLYDVDRIRGSGIGKAVMYLYKHPKETRENKIKAKELISSWSRPIFQLDSNFDAISREEREQRDLELMNKQNRLVKKAPDQKKTEETPLKPGDKGWIPRARVPAPSMKDYVIRPASKVAEEAFRTRSRPSIVFKNKLPRRRYV